MPRRFAVLAALVTVAPLGVLAPFGTAARASVPSDVVAATPVRHVVTDVDGDGSPDQVTQNYLGARQFELAVTTKGASATVRFTSYVDTDETPASDTWYGASAIDGHAGSELIVNLFTASSATYRENVVLGVYTWRSGRLVAEKAPAAPWGRAWVVNASGSGQARGYRFFTSNGHRYVDATRLTEGNTRWTGTVTRSVWRHGEWVKASTRRAASVADPAWKATGIAGPKLLQGQLSADVDGDGTADLVAAYRTGSAHYLVRASTATRKVEKTLSAFVDPPFLGAAQTRRHRRRRADVHRRPGRPRLEGADLAQREAHLPALATAGGRGGKPDAVVGGQRRVRDELRLHDRERGGVRDGRRHGSGGLAVRGCGVRPLDVAEREVGSGRSPTGRSPG